MIQQPKHIVLKKRAEIAYFSLPKPVCKKFDRLMSIMQEDIQTLVQQRKIYKLNVPFGENQEIFILRIDVRLRALIEFKESDAIISDIVDHNSLRRFFNGQKR